MLFLALATPAWADPRAGAQPAPSQPAVSPSRTSQPARSRLATGGPVDPAGGADARARLGADPATLCEAAVTTAEYVNHLPPRLLAAISLTETGRIDPVSGRLRPWPWTIDAEGEGRFFDSAEAAVAAVEALLLGGVRSIDVGCLQVNLMYHPEAFGSLRQAFDPHENANFAGRFLDRLYAGAKDWPAAIAGYHSETPALGDAYRTLVMARWQRADSRAVTGQIAYGDFAESGRAYGNAAHADPGWGGHGYGDPVYGAFAPSSRVYGAFAPR
jgi:hypothetical protein